MKISNCKRQLRPTPEFRKLIHRIDKVYGEGEDWRKRVITDWIASGKIEGENSKL